MNMIEHIVITEPQIERAVLDGLIDARFYKDGEEEKVELDNGKDILYFTRIAKTKYYMRDFVL